MNFVKPLLKYGVMLLSLVICSVNARPIKLVTADKVIIHAEVTTPRKLSEKHAAVILIHQGGSNHSEWNFIIPSLTKANYVVLAYDVRGHGKSDKVGKLGQLFNDPNLAPKDLEAALKYLKGKKYVDDSRIAVVGASIGGNLANVAIANMGVKTAVAISGKTSAVFNLAGKKTLEMQSVFYISSNERGGQRAGWAKELYDLTKEPRKITIVPKSDEHGVGIFKDEPGLEYEILKWLKETL